MSQRYIKLKPWKNSKRNTFELELDQKFRHDTIAQAIRKTEKWKFVNNLNLLLVIYCFF